LINVRCNNVEDARAQVHGDGAAAGGRTAQRLHDAAQGQREYRIHIFHHMWPSGGIRATYATGRGFHSRTLPTFVNRLWVFLNGMYVFTKKNVRKYILVLYLESTTQAL
jgi:hypothetical protein